MSFYVLHFYNKIAWAIIMAYWLMKSEPDVLSIDALRKRPGKTEHWDGVRNYQARNMMRDDMKKGDLVLFYHSSCKQPGIAGIAEIVKEGYVDHTAFDPRQKYYDPKSDPAKPRWYMVDVRYKRKFKRTVSLSELRLQKKLRHMKLLQPGNRLSIMPVTKQDWDFILKLEKVPG
jgi:predicted RNA-binding protein with PUA-like domain